MRWPSWIARPTASRPRVSEYRSSASVSDRARSRSTRLVARADHTEDAAHALRRSESHTVTRPCQMDMLPCATAREPFMAEARTYLFSVDLEHPPVSGPDQEKLAPRVEPNTLRYLDSLERHGFRRDVLRGRRDCAATPRPRPRVSRGAATRSAATRTGTSRSTSNRPRSSAPTSPKRSPPSPTATPARSPDTGADVFSLTEKTQWAYDILAELGIRYSSSVLPAPNPLFGWPEFGVSARRMTSGVLEIPMTPARVGPLRVPVGGGVYFRVLPFPLILARDGPHGPRDGRHRLLPPLRHRRRVRTHHARGHPRQPFLSLALILQMPPGVFVHIDCLVAAGHRIETYASYSARLAA